MGLTCEATSRGDSVTMWGLGQSFSPGYMCIAQLPLPGESRLETRCRACSLCFAPFATLSLLSAYLLEPVLTDSISLRLSPSIVWALTVFCQPLLTDSPTESSFLSRPDGPLFSPCLLSPLVIKGDAWLQLQFVLRQSSKREERRKGIVTLTKTTAFLSALRFAPSLGSFQLKDVFMRV